MCLLFRPAFVPTVMSHASLDTFHLRPRFDGPCPQPGKTSTQARTRWVGGLQAIGAICPRHSADPLGQLLHLSWARRQGAQGRIAARSARGSDPRRSRAAPGPIVPGDAKASELLARIHSHVKSERMPPAEHEEVSQRARKGAAQTLDRRRGGLSETLGVRGSQSSPTVPTPETGRLGPQPIDRFVLARLEAEGLSPRPGSRSLHAGPPGRPRSDRLAAVSGGRGSLRRRQESRCL